jgi:hypothetical protein
MTYYKFVKVAQPHWQFKLVKALKKIGVAAE